jgi:hypothetical protein
MTHWTTSVVAILLASCPSVLSAQVNCEAIPHGPARTDSREIAGTDPQNINRIGDDNGLTNAPTIPKTAEDKAPWLRFVAGHSELGNHPNYEANDDCPKDTHFIAHLECIYRADRRLM